jgi:hypothetical protein
MKIYIKTEERITSKGVANTQAAESNMYMFVKNNKIYELIADSKGNVVSRIECSFYDLRVFKSAIYKEIILGKIFPKN